MKKGYFKIYDEHESLDSSKIEFQFFDEWGDPFYGVNLLEFKNEKVVNGWASDSEGKLVLKRDNSSEDFDFEAQFIGMDFQRIEISFDQNKKVDVYLIDNQIQVISDKIFIVEKKDLLNSHSFTSYLANPR